MTKGAHKAGSEQEPKYPIESVDNALRLILHLRDTPSTSVADAARLLGVAPSTAHRLFAMLQVHGFVEQDPVTRQYQSGPVLTEIGLASLRGFDIRDVVRLPLEKLVARVGETAHLTVLRGATVHFLDGVETDKVLRAGLRVGQSLPAHASAAGKAQLALMPIDRLTELYPSEQLPEVRERTIKTRRQLLAQLEEIREIGYAVNVGESEDHVNAVAAAIQDERGVVHGAITVAAPEIRLPAEGVGPISRALSEATADVVARLRRG